jgi:hypothetical protein
MMNVRSFPIVLVIKMGNRNIDFLTTYINSVKTYAEALDRMKGEKRLLEESIRMTEEQLASDEKLLRAYLNKVMNEYEYISDELG